VPSCARILVLFVDRKHPDNVGELGGKAGIARAFEGARAMWLQLVRPPDALHRTQRRVLAYPFADLIIIEDPKA